MDGDEQFALVAAGAVYPGDGDDEDVEEVNEIREAILDFSALFNEISEAIRDEMATEQEQEERAWELRELLDEDQMELAAELEQLVAEDAGKLGAGDEEIFSDQAVMTRQADAQFTVTEEPEGASSPEEEPVPEVGPSNGSTPVTQPVAQV